MHRVPLTSDRRTVVRGIAVTGAVVLIGALITWVCALMTPSELICPGRVPCSGVPPLMVVSALLTALGSVLCFASLAALVAYTTHADRDRQNVAVDFAAVSMIPLGALIAFVLVVAALYGHLAWPCELIRLPLFRLN